VPTFWDVQKQAILSLHQLGYKLRLSDRIEPFKIYLELNALEQNALVLEAKSALEELVKIRKYGMEPRHHKGRYV
jgi:hypothetical protein